MKFVKALGLGVIGTGVAVSIVFAGIEYEGQEDLSQIKSNITNLKNAIIRVTDEGTRKVRTANENIEEKIEEIKTLEGEVKKGNDEIARLESQLELANNEIDKIADEVQETTDKYKDSKIGPTVVDDSEHKIVDKQLVMTIVQSMDTESTRTMAISNPNGVDVIITVTGSLKDGEYTVKAGDVIYIEKNNSGSMIKVSYTVPGTGEVVNSRPY